MKAQAPGNPRPQLSGPPSTPVRGALGPWREALIELIPVLRAFAWSLSHDASEADDLVQETLVKAWSHREQFTPGSNLRAWLFTILRNTFYTAINRRRRETPDVDGLWAAKLSLPANQDWAVSIGDLRRALRQLPETHREALILVGGAGMTYQEAAAICGCAVGTIKSRVNRARTRLLKLMDGRTDGEEAGDPFEDDAEEA